MNKLIEPQDWQAYCKAFSRRNFQRPTILQMLDDDGSRLEENGVPLLGIDMDAKDAAGPCIEVLLGEDASDERFLCHTVQHVRSISVQLGPDCQDKVLEIVSSDGARTLLHLKYLLEITQ